MAWDLGAPFWRSNFISGESLFFIREEPGAAPISRLLFPPSCPSRALPAASQRPPPRTPLKLQSASRKIEFSSPGDFLLDPETGIISLAPGTRIPFMDRAALYPQFGQDHCMVHKRGDETVGLFFGEEHLFHDLQVQASYEHPATWTGFVPRSQLDHLPQTARKLHSLGDLHEAAARSPSGAKEQRIATLGGVPEATYQATEPMKICVIGDSISAGCNASALSGVPPQLPPYPDLLAQALRRHRPGEVILENFAVSGTGMKYGLDIAENVAKELPDLVVIAYGMNDVGFNPVEDFASQAAQILAIIKRRNPRAEFILVSSMLGNPEWVYTPTENFFIFRDALQRLCGPGVALADLTRLWADLLKVKSYHDLTGNGVNHPNDFGHRIYAQFLLDLLGFGL